MAELGGKFLPQHVDEIDALLSIYPDRISTLSFADGSTKEADETELAAASSGAAYAVLKASIPLNFAENDRDCVVVEAVLDGEADSTNEQCDGLIDSCRPAFERSQSGRRLYCQFSVLELPPLELVVILLPGYPESTPPDFLVLSSCLSNSQKTAVCKKLDDLANENAGQPVIMTWFDWLQNDCLTFLGITNVVLSSPQDPLSPDEIDSRIGDVDLNVLERIESMIRNDIKAEQRRFVESEHECPVCFDVSTGADFLRVDSCRHFCCRVCLLAYVQQSMQDGNVQGLKCPEEKCDEPLPVPIIRAVLSNDEWRRWETLAFNRALDTMGDLDWCPRCQMPVVREEDHQQSHLARCAYCYFAFCTQCKDAWHQGRNCVSLEDKLEELDNARESDEDKVEKARRLFQKKMELLSVMKIRQTAKPCPTCRAPIEKNYGCNKVFCINCHCSMCYKCGQQIENYDHFNGPNSKCPLTDETSNMPYDDNPFYRPREAPQPPDALLQMDIALEMNPDLRRFLTRCPACRQRNLKQNRNNHMRCWACHTTFCYLCRQRVIGGGTKGHFGVTANKCPQHSED